MSVCTEPHIRPVERYFLLLTWFVHFQPLKYQLHAILVVITISIQEGSYYHLCMNLPSQIPLLLFFSRKARKELPGDPWILEVKLWRLSPHQGGTRKGSSRGLLPVPEGWPQKHAMVKGQFFQDLTHVKEFSEGYLTGCEFSNKTRAPGGPVFVVFYYIFLGLNLD